MEHFRKSRTECFPICLPCSCCEYGKFSLKMGILKVQSWEKPSLPLLCQSFLKYPNKLLVLTVLWCPHLSLRLFAQCPLLLTHVFLKDFIIDPNTCIWQLGDAITLSDGLNFT